MGNQPNNNWHVTETNTEKGYQQNDTLKFKLKTNQKTTETNTKMCHQPNVS